MPGRAKDVLLVLFQHRGEPVSKEELLLAIWGRHGGEHSNLYRAITDCKKALRLCDPDNEYIESLREYGYRFAATDLREVGANREAPKTEAVVSDILAAPTPDTLFLHVVAGLYGLLSGLMVIVEVTYKLDEYPLAVVVAVLATVWTYVTSVGIIRVVQGQTPKRPVASLTLGALAFFIAAILLVVMVSQYLPASAVTEQTSQPATAQAAYLKSTLYHFFLVLPFMIIPYHFVVTQRAQIQQSVRSKQRGAIYISPAALLAILLVYFFYAVTAHHSLTGSLKPSPYMNIFIILLWVRLAAFFAVAVVSLMWYVHRLNELKDLSLAVEERVWGAHQ
jgi:DNA-binding winged helix-turn-helix (wHTH) protein